MERPFAAVKEIKRLTRALLFHAVRRYGEKLNLSSLLLVWAPRHAAAVNNRSRVGSDGLTPDIRLMGRSGRRPALQFGELLHVQRAGLGEGYLGASLCDDRYIGHHERTGAAMIISNEGFSFGMGVSRRDPERRWLCEGLADLRGMRWGVKAEPRRAVEGGEAGRLDFPRKSYTGARSQGAVPLED